jgi:CelD/BcsL family acetyltransferase involved in cellulose biosynthesis
VSNEQVIGLEEVESEESAAFSIRSEPFETLEREWAQLHAAAGHGPFQHPAWHAAWLRHFGAGVEPVYLAVRRGEQLIGVAPLHMANGSARELGDPNVRDYAGPLALEEFANDVVLALLDWVAEDMTPRLELWGMRRADPLIALFQAEAADNGWDLAIEHEALAPVATLPDDFESFVASLGKHDRHELRRKMRNLEASGDVRYEALAGPAAIEPELDTLFAMMRVSHEGKEEFLSPAMEAFFRDLAATFAPLGMMRLGRLSLDGRPIALLFAFEDERGVYLYNSGFDPEFGRLAAGLLSKAYAIRDAITRGKRTFDFLRGEEDYKKRLGGEPRDVLRLTFTRR